MDGARRDAPAGESQVQPLRLERALTLGALERRELLRDERLDLALGLVRLLADARALGGGDGPERAQESRQLAGAAEHADADLLEFGRGAGPGDLRPDPVEDRLDPRVPHSGRS